MKKNKKTEKREDVIPAPTMNTTPEPTEHKPRDFGEEMNHWICTGFYDDNLLYESTDCCSSHCKKEAYLDMTASMLSGLGTIIENAHPLWTKQEVKQEIVRLSKLWSVNINPAHNPENN